jgi:hypothetical protein
MVDAKGKTVGRLAWNVYSSSQQVMRQIDGVWVVLIISDLTTGFLIDRPPAYVYQSTDCTGQTYLATNAESGQSYPILGTVAAVPPAASASIYFAGPPYDMLLMKSGRSPGESCFPFDGGGANMAVGLAHSVTVSSLDLTPPFFIK